MSRLKIKDMPPVEVVDGTEIIPTGGKGDVSVTIERIKNFVYAGTNFTSLSSQLQTVDLRSQTNKVAIDSHIADLLNPHQVTKAQVGLSNVDNTSDLNKPVSTATQAALTTLDNTKANTTYVDAGLNVKANITYVDDNLSLKENLLALEAVDLIPSSSFDNVKNTNNLVIDYTNQSLLNRTEYLKTHNNLVGRDVANAHPASAIVDESGLSQQIYNRLIKNQILTHKNLRDLGVKGDGSDESTFLQTVFDSLDGIDLDFGGLTISVAKQVNIINRERFKLRNGAVKATPDFKSDTHVQPVVNITRSSHWSIYDFNFDGNRFNRVQPVSPAEPVWHTLQIYGGCKNFYMQNVNLYDGLMENLYICGGTQPNWDDIPTGGTFVNVQCDKGFRNSSAIIHGIDLVFINSSFTGAYGNANGPCAGLDIESNNDGGALINLQFIGCKFEGNSKSQVQVSGKDYTRSIKFLGGTIKGGAYPDSSPIVWYSSAAIFDGVTISGFAKTTGEQVIRIPSSEAGEYPDRFFMRNCTLEDISAPTIPLFYVHSHSGGLDFNGNTVRNITCLELGHIYGGNNNISGNSFDAITGKNWQYDTVVSGNEPVVNISDNVFKNITGSMRIVGKLYKNTFIDCGTDVAATYVARVAGTTSTAIENKFIATTAQTKNALVSVDTACASYNNTVNYSNPFSITNTDAVTQRTVALGNTKDGLTVNFDFLINLGTQDLNTLYQRNATFVQTSGANGTTARNYPINGFYGTVQVVDITTSGDYVYCTQIATFAGEKLQWIRKGTRFAAGSVSWQAWDIIPNSSLASRGTTASRPTTYLFNGRIYFDTTLAAGGKPIWYTSGQWVDATGATV